MGKTFIEARRKYDDVVTMYFENYTLEEVGQKYSITRERVRQIINQMGYKTRDVTLTPKETLRKNRWFVQTFRERFWSQVQIGTESGCWEWQGTLKPSGYGYISIRIGINQSKGYYAHRMAYYLYYKTKPKQHVLHSCDNRKCVNPHHLRDGSPLENTADRQSRNYETWHKNLTSSIKLTEQNVMQMVELHRQGKTGLAIAEQFNVSSNRVYLILGGKVKKYQKFLS